MKVILRAHRFGRISALLFLTALLTAGCGAVAMPTAANLTPMPTVVLGGSPTSSDSDMPADTSARSGDITASGVVVPADQVVVAAAISGNLTSLDVEVGDTVKAGQVLASFAGIERLTAAVEAANLELLAAEQALANLIENSHQARAQAQLRLAKAQDAFDQAEKRRGWKEYRVGNDNQIAVARADLIVAQDRVKTAEDTFGSFADNPEDNLNKAAALSALSAARTARDKAQANLNYLLSLPDPIEVAKADAELEVARTELEAAQREFDRLQNGPDPEARALAEARVKNARAQLAASQVALDDIILKAPIEGTVSRVNLHNGEWVLPGQAILTISDLEHLRVETTDLSERSVPGVAVDQRVIISVEALNQEITGRVVEIAPLADTIGGDVVYKTTIELDSIPDSLRAGMSVNVYFKNP
jgi:HlyD family secretion protein